MLYSYLNQYPTESIPERIRLSSGLTKTDSSTFTEEDLRDAGYVRVNSAPTYNTKTHKINWNENIGDWQILPLSENEIESGKINKWIEIRDARDVKIKEVEWKVFRYQSEIRLGLTPTDNIQQLDEYIQALRDITKQEDPYSISWPSIP